ncbi:MAG: hypothetical protein ACE5GJ_01560 [Gemmatimonadota bacterium]
MFFLHLHSGFRYLALLAGLATVGYALWGLVRHAPHDRTMDRLAVAFRAAMDVTAILGVALLFGGRFYGAVGTHAVTMVLATAVSHVVPAVMRRRPPEERTYAPYLVATLVALALVAVGTLALGRPVVG